MNSTSRRIFPLLKPLSPLVLEPLKAVAQTANSLSLPYFLAGATARDLVLENIFGRAPGKLTRDLDFGFVLSDWKQFENLKAALMSTGRFKPDRAIQRVLYQHSAGISVRVDLIPFGGVQEGSQISWPPDNDFVMNVAGFKEALESAIQVQVESDLVVPVTSLPGLIILKLFAWAPTHSALIGGIAVALRSRSMTLPSGCEAFHWVTNAVVSSRETDRP
jgi:predicted nucleotidyltransferase